MGACFPIPGKPLPVNIQLPAGARISSMASGTQQVPNAMDPFQSVIEGVQPVLSAVKPVFDIVGLVMAAMEVALFLFKLLGSLVGMFAPGNPFSLLFGLPPMTDADGNPIVLVPKIEVSGVVIFPGGPEIPDFASAAPEFLEKIIRVLCYALKLAGIEPHLSTVAMIKDSMLTAMGFADAAMAQVNTLTDLFTGIPPANTGNPTIDALLQCAADNSVAQLEHKLGPVGNLAPLMSILSLIADIAKTPLPSVIVDMVRLLANTSEDEEPGFGIIPFPDLSGVGGPTPDEQRQQLMDFLEEMEVSGLPIEIPDFSDLSNLGETLNDMQEQLGPLLSVAELLQSILDKLTKC